MDNVKILEVKQSIFASNDEQAAQLRQSLKEKKIFLLNLMSAPGSGKTTTLRSTIAALKDELRIGVMEADIDSDVDAKAIAAAGAKAIQLHTGGMCHLDAEMTRQGLEGLGPQDVDLVVLENVGNLVCPAEFDTGAVKNAMILSVPEGDDKPLKYPLMFQVCDVVLINKIDVLPYFDFDMDKCREYIAIRNPNAKVIPICAKTGEGMAEWTDWLREQRVCSVRDRLTARGLILGVEHQRLGAGRGSLRRELGKIGHVVRLRHGADALERGGKRRVDHLLLEGKNALSGFHFRQTSHALHAILAGLYTVAHARPILVLRLLVIVGADLGALGLGIGRDGTRLLPCVRLDAAGDFFNTIHRSSFPSVGRGFWITSSC